MAIVYGMVAGSLRVWGGLGLAGLALVGLGCSSSGGGGGGGGGAAEPAVTTRTLQLGGGGVEQVPLAAGEVRRFTFTSTQPGPDGPFEGLALDLARNLAFATADAPAPRSAPRATPAAASGTAQVRVLFGSEEQGEAVCDAGFAYGPYTVGYGTVPSPASGTVRAEPATVNLVNAGAFTVCVEVTPSVDVVLTMPRVELEATACAEDAALVEGRWQGTYSCTDVCDPEAADRVLAIDLTITQEGNNATYTDDGGGRFEGTVCGNRFRFSGGYGCTGLVCDEVEDGTFTLTGADSGIKTSSYSYRDGLGNECGGECRDSLTRVGQPL